MPVEVKRKCRPPKKVWNSSHPVHTSVTSLTTTFESHKVRSDPIKTK